MAQWIGLAPGSSARTVCSIRSVTKAHVIVPRKRLRFRTRKQRASALELRLYLDIRALDRASERDWFAARVDKQENANTTFVRRDIASHASIWPKSDHKLKPEL